MIAGYQIEMTYRKWVEKGIKGLIWHRVERVETKKWARTICTIIEAVNPDTVTRAVAIRSDGRLDDYAYYGTLLASAGAEIEGDEHG